MTRILAAFLALLFLAACGGSDSGGSTETAPVVQSNSGGGNMSDDDKPDDSYEPCMGNATCNKIAKEFKAAADRDALIAVDTKYQDDPNNPSGGFQSLTPELRDALFMLFDMRFEELDPNGMDEDEEVTLGGTGPDEDEDEEETTDMMSMSPWEKSQQKYLTARTMYDSKIMVGEHEYMLDTARDTSGGTFTYSGDITGEMNPGSSHLSDPKIALTYDSAKSTIGAAISYEFNEDMSRVTLDRYGTRVNADGTFSSFDGLNPKGFDGAFYGDNAFAAGNVSTPRVHGTYIAGQGN